MEDRHEEIWKQYDMEIHNVYRARGAYILETSQGLKLYKNYEGSENKVEFEQSVKEHLFLTGYTNVDLYMRNLAGELVSSDSLGGKYVIKNWFMGEECNLKDERDIIAAARNLANLHNHMKNIRIEDANLKDKYTSNLISQFDKHNRELKRVRSYIREKKQKNEFEVCFLSSYVEFYEQGLEALDILKQSDYMKQLEECQKHNIVCHGNYIYHNIIMGNAGIATTNFEKVCISVQMFDLYGYIRKVMEKNNWNIPIGTLILNEYNRTRTISMEELRILYVLLLYPEKFWKVTNFYYNARKSWVPQRNIQKMISLQEQVKEKMLFLNHMKSQLDGNE
ncbi:MAG TPA: CotS family spore coat protein [Lachnospiraceae bacterium]|nr:CotS family spore coat protein [Lachnospiraceae bacterium]